jgi:hypothetical protein
MNVNNIVSTTIQTVEKLKEYSNWWNALFLYFDYIKHSRIQWTNQVWCNDEFMMKSIWYWVDKFRSAKNLLKEIWLIEVIQNRWTDWKLWKYYIKINFLIWEDKREKSIKPESGENQSTEKPESGKPTSNALSNINKILEEENKMLKEYLSKDKEQSSIVKTSETIVYWNNEINLILKSIKDNHWTIDWTISEQRNFWKLLKDKIATIDNFNWDYYWFIDLIIKNSDEYRIWKTTSPKKIYYNLAELMANIKAKYKPVKSCVC